MQQQLIHHHHQIMLCCPVSICSCVHAIHLSYDRSILLQNMNPNNLESVEWSNLPIPLDDGAMDHIRNHNNYQLPSPCPLVSTSGDMIDLGSLMGRTVVYAYPMTGQPGIALPEGWDHIPGARGCTPHSCAFRDHFRELILAGANAVYGISTQDTNYQREMVQRLHLPFPVLSDKSLVFTKAAKFPTMTIIADGGTKTLLRRFALIIDDGIITKVFYPIFPPDQNASDVLEWLQAHPKQAHPI